MGPRVIGPDAVLNAVAAHSRFHAGPAGPAYNEAAFRHFLAVDRSRARRSRRSLYLLLVFLRESRGRRAQLTDATAAALFRGLGESVREVDLVGWYQEGRVAAAVLSQGAKTTGGASAVIADRVLTALKKQLTASQSIDLRLRVVRLGRTVDI
jgi:hypothetical protein